MLNASRITCSTRNRPTLHFFHRMDCCYQAQQSAGAAEAYEEEGLAGKKARLTSCATPGHSVAFCVTLELSHAARVKRHTLSGAGKMTKAACSKETPPALKAPLMHMLRQPTSPPTPLLLPMQPAVIPRAAAPSRGRFRSGRVLMRARCSTG